MHILYEFIQDTLPANKIRIIKISDDLDIVLAEYVDLYTVLFLSK